MCTNGKICRDFGVCIVVYTRLTLDFDLGYLDDLISYFFFFLGGGIQFNLSVRHS